MMSRTPQPTAWLDVTKSGDNLIVAWNSERYVLTAEQARRFASALHFLTSTVDDRKSEGEGGGFVGADDAPAGVG